MSVIAGRQEGNSGRAAKIGLFSGCRVAGSLALKGRKTVRKPKWKSWWRWWQLWHALEVAFLGGSCWQETGAVAIASELGVTKSLLRFWEHRLRLRFDFD